MRRGPNLLDDQIKKLAREKRRDAFACKYVKMREKRGVILSNNDTHKKDYFHTLIFTAHFENIGITFSIFGTLKTSKLSSFQHINFYICILEPG